MKRITTFFLTIFLFAGILNAQSTFDKLFFDFELPQSNGWGIHGVQVDPDGNVWIAIFGDLAKDTIFAANGDTLNIRPIYVLDPNTGEHVSFSPIRFLEWPDGKIDTITGSARGIERDNDGNMLVTGPLGGNTIVRIDYKTGKPLGKWVAPNTGSMTEAVQAPDGNIYVTHVVPGGKPMYMIDNDLNFIANAIDSVKYINRTIEVSQDGMELYTGSTWNGFGIPHFHSDAPGLTQFTPVDTLGNWFNVAGKTADGRDTVFEKINLWASCLDFAPDGVLWAGNLREDWSGPGGGKGSMWYGFDVTTGKIVDSVGIPLGDSTQGGVYSPRGAAWSNDGKKMYLADFDYNTITVWNYNSVVSVKEIPGTVPTNFTLSQNYPNPFNPTTTISFTLPESGLVTLKVYNMLGQEVATLVNEVKAAGNYKATLNAKDLSSGTYIYSLKAGDTQITKKMTLLK